MSIAAVTCSAIAEKNRYWSSDRLFLTKPTKVTCETDSFGIALTKTINERAIAFCLKGIFEK
ncbi:MAG TPA: hypothetical protein V6C71_19875 [Coleofasciculaceae cyanobacterium]